MAEQYFTPVTFSTTQSEFQLFWWNFHCVISRSMSGSGQTSPSSSINVAITFLITFTITHKRHVQVIQPTSGTWQPTKYNSRISTKGYNIINHNTGRSSFMPELHSCKTICKWNTKFPFKTKYFWRLADWQPHHAYTLYDYTASRHMDLKNMYVLYKQYIHIFTYSIHTFLYNIFISIPIKPLETHTHSYWYRSFQ